MPDMPNSENVLMARFPDWPHQAMTNIATVLEQMHDHGIPAPVAGNWIGHIIGTVVLAEEIATLPEEARDIAAAVLFPEAP